jgi:hypothetical protein
MMTADADTARLTSAHPTMPSAQEISLTEERSMEERLEPPSREPPPVAGSPVRRFEVVAVTAIVAAGVVYFWVLWDLWSGTLDPLRTINAVHSAYDAQARAILNGRLTLPNGSISGEAFIHNGHTYTYFGIFPSILRMPILLMTHSLDGRLTPLSMAVAWVVTAVFSTLLLWRIRVVLRGDRLLGWTEAGAYSILIFSILAGSVLLFLGSQPDVYTEDLSWSVALACATFFALVGVAERPSWGRVLSCGLLILLTNLNRSTTGYACILAALLFAVWFGLGRAGADNRRWAIPMLLAGFVPLAAGCAIDYAKFGILIGFPASKQILFNAFGFSHINGGHYWGLRFLPSTLQAYVDPSNIRMTSLFPYITLPDNPTHPIAHTALFTRAPTAGVVPSMPLLFAAGVWGVVSAFMPKQRSAARALRILLVAAAVTAGAVMVFGWILERFVGDFMPLLILASTLGMVDIWSRLADRRRTLRVVVLATIAVLATFGVLANVGFAITPDASWTQVQADNYVGVQQDFSDITGHPLASDVVRGTSFPLQAPVGRLFIRGNCDALYVADQAVPTGIYFTSEYWIPVERAPHTPLCHALIAKARSVPFTAEIVFPTPNAAVSGPKVTLGAFAATSGTASVSFVLSGMPLHNPITVATFRSSSGIWIYSWDSRTVPNGTYSLRSVVTKQTGERTTSPGVAISVQNGTPKRSPTPSTTSP